MNPNGSNTQGEYSTTLGYQNTASGKYSTALGIHTTAFEDY